MMPLERETRPDNPLDRLALELSTLGPVGHLPRAPGTWGSLVAVLFAPWFFLVLPPYQRLLLLAVLFILGGLVADRVEKALQIKDPGQVVVDELVGQWAVFVPFATLELWHIGLGFVLFRCFDVFKPWPIRASEHWLPGGFGVMLDDLIAGIYGALVLLGVRLFL